LRLYTLARHALYDAVCDSIFSYLCSTEGGGRRGKALNNLNGLYGSLAGAGETLVLVALVVMVMEGMKVRRIRWRRRILWRRMS